MWLTLWQILGVTYQSWTGSAPKLPMALAALDLRDHRATHQHRIDDLHGFDVAQDSEDHVTGRHRAYDLDLEIGLHVAVDIAHEDAAREAQLSARARERGIERHGIDPGE